MSMILLNKIINYLLTEGKRQELIKLKKQKTFIDYSQTTDDVYENVKDYNPMKKRKVLIVFDDIIAGMKANKKLSPRVTEFFLRERKLNILLVFISQYYLKVSKSMRLNSRHYFIIEIPKKRALTNSIKSFV